MQQNQQRQRFDNSAQQQPVYRFPQNQSAQGWQPQQAFSAQPSMEPSLTNHDRRALRRRHKPRRRIFTLWNLFAIIGIITVMIQCARYIIIPLLVYLNVLAGGGI